MVLACVAASLVAGLIISALYATASVENAQRREVRAIYLEFVETLARKDFVSAANFMEPNYRNLLLTKKGYMDAFSLEFSSLAKPEIYPKGNECIKITDGAAVVSVGNTENLGYLYEVSFIKHESSWLMSGSLQLITGG